MRLWHYKLLPYLPDAQFKGQLRELVAIMHDWRDKGKRVTSYPREELYNYFLEYADHYRDRYGKKVPEKYYKEFLEFASGEVGLEIRETDNLIYSGWHDKTYLRICMANLYEKYLGVGNSRVTDSEWEKLKDGYKTITGKEYYL